LSPTEVCEVGAEVGSNTRRERVSPRILAVVKAAPKNPQRPRSISCHGAEDRESDARENTGHEDENGMVL
jgi:hypothetical protein